MTYYLLLDGDSEKDVIYDTNILGEESFGKFYIIISCTSSLLLICHETEYNMECIFVTKH